MLSTIIHQHCQLLPRASQVPIHILGQSPPPCPQGHGAAGDSGSPALGPRSLVTAPPGAAL